PARPVLRGGRGRADRHERGLHRQRRLRGDPGHGRAGAVQPRPARPAARTRRRGLRRADQPRRCRAGVIAGPGVAATQPDVTAMAADTVVLATRNAAKLRELARILGAEDHGEQIRLAGLDEFPGAPDVPETGATFEENGLLKARAIADYTGLPAVADDSGLCVDALNGMPGVLSARWAGRHGDDKANLELVLAQVTDVPDTRLGAQFVCAAALVVPGPNAREWVVTGQVEGRLIRAPRGSGGFGYDPIFLPDGFGETTAEMTAEAKDAISHRGRAFRALTPFINRLAHPREDI